VGWSTEDVCSYGARVPGVQRRVVVLIESIVVTTPARLASLERAEGVQMRRLSFGATMGILRRLLLLSGRGDPWQY
jgi:hypothetical protein